MNIIADKPRKKFKRHRYPKDVPHPIPGEVTQERIVKREAATNRRQVKRSGRVLKAKKDGDE